MLHLKKFYPRPPKNLHRLICHICDISQLCTTPKCRVNMTLTMPITTILVTMPIGTDTTTVIGTAMTKARAVLLILLFLVLWLLLLLLLGYSNAEYRDVSDDSEEQSDSSDSESETDSDSSPPRPPSPPPRPPSPRRQTVDKYKYKYKYKHKYKYKYKCKYKCNWICMKQMLSLPLPTPVRRSARSWEEICSSKVEKRKHTEVSRPWRRKIENLKKKQIQKSLLIKLSKQKLKL